MGLPPCGGRLFARGPRFLRCTTAPPTRTDPTIRLLCALSGGRRDAPRDPLSDDFVACLHRLASFSVYLFGHSTRSPKSDMRDSGPSVGRERAVGRKNNKPDRVQRASPPIARCTPFRLDDPGCLPSSRAGLTTPAGNAHPPIWLTLVLSSSTDSGNVAERESLSWRVV